MMLNIGIRTVVVMGIAWMLCGGLPASVGAQDVELVTGAPMPADELGSKLYGGLGNTKSIVIDDKPVVPNAIGMMVEFSVNSSEILPESRPYLDEVGKMLKLDRYNKERLEVEGHADASGPAPYNMALSRRRAEAVANYLVRQHDIEPQRLAVVARGEESPLPGRSPTDPQNRRVQFRAAN